MLYLNHILYVAYRLKIVDLLKKKKQYIFVVIKHIVLDYAFISNKNNGKLLRFKEHFNRILSVLHKIMWIFLRLFRFR